MAAPVCELRDVGKAYRGRFVIDGITLDVAAAEMIAVTGRSGSGKSTLLNIVGLLESPDCGDLHLFGERAPAIGSSGATRLLRSRLGYLFQNYALIDDDTVDANLELAQMYVSGSRRAHRDAREAALATVGLPHLGRRKVYELSGGEQQRVAIARLILKPCELILADEPTGSLDAATGGAILRMLRDFTAQGRTVVIVSHDQHVVAACDRVFPLPDRASETHLPA